MARMLFGGGPEDVYLVEDEDGDLQPAGGQPARFYTSEAGTTQYTDLRSMNDEPVDHILTSDGNDDRAVGQIPPFWGPPDVFEMWCSVNNSPRVLLQASNLGSFVGATVLQMQQHLSAGAVNPHSTTFLSLADVDAATFTDAVAGTPVVKGASGQLVAGTAGGGGGGAGMTLDTDQTVTGTKTFDAPATGGEAKQRLVVRALAVGQTADIFRAYCGTDQGQGAVRVITFWLSDRGEARCRPSKTSGTAFAVVAQPGQTGNLVEYRDSTGAAKAWMAANFASYAPNSGRTVTFTVSGAVANGVGVFRWYNDTGVPLTIRSVRASLGTASSAGTPTVDVNVSGTTIYTTQSNRPTIAVGAVTSGKNVAHQVLTVPDGGYVTADVDVTGTGAQNLTVQIELW